MSRPEVASRFDATRSGATLPTKRLSEKPRFESLTIMLTELCNLDCWMCDFATSKGLRAELPWNEHDLLIFLGNPYFAHLHSVGFTGGEPFASKLAMQFYQALVERRPDLFLSFSSNGLLLKPMIDTLALTKNWKKVKLFSSIDGVLSHDTQRGRPGALRKTADNLCAVQERFPELVVEVKFTVTPRNHEELGAAFDFCTERGFDFTAKLVEVNPYYTSQLSLASHANNFQFMPSQLDSVRRQLDAILAKCRDRISKRRQGELQELRSSLEPGWQRKGRCVSPHTSAFLDAQLRLFTCKEFPPVLDLKTQSLDDICNSPAYEAVAATERKNGAPCTRCTSQLKKASQKPIWLRWLT